MYAARKQIGNIAHGFLLATCVYAGVGGAKCFKLSAIFYHTFIVHVCSGPDYYTSKSELQFRFYPRRVMFASAS